MRCTIVLSKQEIPLFIERNRKKLRIFDVCFRILLTIVCLALGTACSDSNGTSVNMEVPSSDNGDNSSSATKDSISTSSSTTQNSTVTSKASKTVISQKDSTNSSAIQTSYVWRKNIYEPSITFDSCVFPDYSDSNTRKKGEEITELMFLRSIIKEKFIWRNEVEDIDPNTFLKSPKTFSEHLDNLKDKKGYYSRVLRSSKTFTGKNTDGKYIVVESTEDLNAQRKADRSASFGINWGRREVNGKKEVYIRYKEGKGSQRKTLNELWRGDRLISVDDVNVSSLLESGQDAMLKSLLYPEKVGTPRKFLFIDVYSQKEKTVYLTSDFPVAWVVNTHWSLSTDTGYVGYLMIPRLDTYGEEWVSFPDQEFNYAISSLNWWKVKDVIVDLRYAREGKIEIASQLAYLIAGDVTKKKIFAHYKGSSKLIDPTPFINYCLNIEFNSCTYSDGSIPIVSWPYHKRSFIHVLNLKRVYVIVTNETCDVAEVFINSLLGIDFEVILIGDNTCGKPYFGSFVGSCGIKYFVPEYQVLNNKKFGGFEKGFRPSNAEHLDGIPVKGCYVEDSGIILPLPTTKDPFVAAALQYRKDGKCPAIPKKILGRSD